MDYYPDMSEPTNVRSVKVNQRTQDVNQSTPPSAISSILAALLSPFMLGTVKRRLLKEPQSRQSWHLSVAEMIVNRCVIAAWVV